MDVKNRDRSIDAYRGCAVALMVLVHFLSRVTWVPAWFKNTPDIGLSPADLVALLFIYSMGLTYPASYRRRADRDGVWPQPTGPVRSSLLAVGVRTPASPRTWLAHECARLADRASRCSPGRRVDAGSLGL